MSLASRVAVLFAVCLALFGLLGMRLWFIQVAEGAEAAEVTENQSWVEIDTPAPRGDIRDRKGEPLVTSRFVPAVVVDRHLVTRDQKDVLIQRLSALLAIPAEEIAEMYDAAGVNGVFPVATVDSVTAYQIKENLRQFPGVRIEKIPQRVYLVGDTLAHVIGQLGLPDAQDLEERPELDPNVRIGQSGVEAVYDRYLSGEPGSIAYRVANGEIVVENREVPATPGATVYLTVDLALQEIVEQALRDGIALSNEWKQQRRADGFTDGVRNETTRGAAVVLDAKTGAVVAMASVPTYDPSLFVAGIDEEVYRQLTEQKAFLNLASAGLYPPASTFKAITYMAALENDIPLPQGVEGVDPSSGLVHCDGRLELSTLDDGSPQVFLDWYQGDKGWLDLHGAFEQSCNIYFYSLALGVWQNWKRTPRETVIQDLARRLGLGSPTGVDLTSDPTGIVPDRELFLAWQERQREDPEAPRLLDPSRLELDDPWFGGDLMNVAIGQGALAVTPLQMAVAYAALTNGGTVWRPYVVEQIRDDGRMLFANGPEAAAQVSLDPANVESLLTDLNRVVTRGTAAAAFAGFGDSLSRVGGKTGTGQSLANLDDHAWFIGVAPIDDPRYVVVVLIEEGGSGGAVAAPVARYIMQYLMGEELDPIVAGAAAQ
ncbi:MAG: penicillin-binding protein 2 [Acidimicrobiia bacterium]|nr:MAG: penicillin-binding protein 2 [Acidimicrobiia bacterium]